MAVSAIVTGATMTAMPLAGSERWHVGERGLLSALERRPQDQCGKCRAGARHDQHDDTDNKRP